MVKKTLMTCLITMIAILASDSPGIDVSKLFAGRQTWTLEEFSSAPAARAAWEITPAASAGDYYICKESPGGSKFAIVKTVMEVMTP